MLRGISDANLTTSPPDLREKISCETPEGTVEPRHRPVFLPRHRLGLLNALSPYTATLFVLRSKHSVSRRGKASHLLRNPFCAGGVVEDRGQAVAVQAQQHRGLCASCGEKPNACRDTTDNLARRWTSECSRFTVGSSPPNPPVIDVPPYSKSMYVQRTYPGGCFTALKKKTYFL